MTTLDPPSDAPHERRDLAPTLMRSAAIGALAYGAALAVGELLAGVVTSAGSPLVAVGDQAIDLAPEGPRNFAIDTFGTADKPVLVGGVLVLLAVAAAALGVLAVRRSVAIAAAGAAALGVVGAAAATGRGSDDVLAPVPSLVGAAVAAGALALLAGPARRGWGGGARDDGPPPDDTVVSMAALRADGRRRFIASSLGLGAVAVVAASAGRALAAGTGAVVERARSLLPRPAAPLPPVSAGALVDVAGVAPFLTPNDRFFRIDTALTVPRVDTDTWRLRVTGDVRRELTLTYRDLLQRPMVEADITIACVSNEVGGDLVGTARWLGCRLDDLLDEAGVLPRADQVVGRSVDGFTAGFPTALLDGRDALVAVGMNGDPLPARHGFPARLVVPGVYGYVSATKWLSEIVLTRFDEFEGYWIPRGWSREGPVKTQSRIDTPRAGATVTAGRPVAVAGVAWAPTKGIERVEVQVDDGPWRDAELAEEHAATTWRQWRYRWVPTEGEHRLRVRATDGTGRTQTGRVTDVAPDGATGRHTVRVTAAPR
jgi:DMSO/TMAO reductase YedYZ molybdopterin-dependent catalytic subunit